MPKWELFGRETWTMEGDPAICMIADTWLKGVRDFDIRQAYEAFLKSADTPGAENLMRPDNDPYLDFGYIPLGYFAADFSGDNSVSHALEYYLADYALSQLAASLGYEEDAARLKSRSLGYRNYYSAEYGCLRPIRPDGTFLSPFDPADGANFSNAPGFHEGSAWNYTFAVPHDVEGYARLMGGSKEYLKRLQKVFNDGLYDPANEPDIVYPYLFSRFKMDLEHGREDSGRPLQEYAGRPSRQRRHRHHERLGGVFHAGVLPRLPCRPLLHPHPPGL